MLERGSYIPSASRFRQYINRKRENRKWLNKALDEGPYQFQMFVPTGSTLPTLQTAEDLQGDELLHYDAEIELMNLILLSIPNEIYNSVDACTTAKEMWKRVELDSFDDLFDYLQQFEKLVNASWVKKLEKSHDPLALVAHTGSSFRNTSSYYVTHPTSMVDYDDEYQQDDVQTNSEISSSAMLLLARAITQNFSNLTNTFRLRYFIQHQTQAIIQGDRVNIQSRNSGNYFGSVQCYNCSGKGHYIRNCPKPRVRDSKYFMEQMLLAKQDEAGVILTDEYNDFLFADASRMEEIEELSANICLMDMIQPADNTSDVGPSYDSAFISEIVPTSRYVVPTVKLVSNKDMHDTMPLLATMLPPAQPAIAGESSGEAEPTIPHTVPETLTEPAHSHDQASSPPRPTTIPASAQENEQGPFSDLNPASSFRPHASETK
ncbi:retrovirus-related pol polyprotein from transposon TNT 1-94 [Tanacetum coccineum]